MEWKQVLICNWLREKNMKHLDFLKFFGVLMISWLYLLVFRVETLHFVFKKFYLKMSHLDSHFETLPLLAGRYTGVVTSWYLASKALGLNIFDYFSCFFKSMLREYLHYQ